MITTASPAHLDGIRKLWQEAFGDSTEYINLFLEQKAELQNTLVCLDGNTVTGMLFILPCSLVIRQASHPCAYLYSVATLQEARGRGIATRLLQHAYQLCGSRGYAVCALHPATSSLFGFYSAAGYATQGYVRTLSLDAATLQAPHATAVLSPIDQGKLFAMRRAAFGDAYLEWDSRSLAFILAENTFFGGSFYCYELEGRQGYLSCIPHGDTLTVTEFAGDCAVLSHVLAALHRIYSKQHYHVRLHSATGMGELTPFAMTKWLTAAVHEPFYLSHMCD